MAEVTRSQVFGPNSTETIEGVTISKIDLAVMGLVAAASNKAESLFAAIFKQLLPIFTVEAYGTNLDQSINIQPQTKTYQTRSDGSSVLVRAFLVEIVEPDTDTGIDPEAL